MAARPHKDYGGGLNVSKTAVQEHPAGPPKHGELGQAERAFTLASTFLSGVLAISASQFIGAPLKLIDPTFYDAYMAYTKESFAVLITSLTQWWAPTVVRVSGDSSVRGQLVQGKDGSLQCQFPQRLVLMANHQLYTDWLYLWWIAYTNRMHGYIYIILKESLKNIPIIGWGCQFYNFIFLSRKWETDMPRFKQALAHLKKATDPMWLLIFPEGTNLSATTRAKSKAWAEKNGLQDMKHQLLPRSTGLRFCLQELKDTTEWLYDCTIAYEGVPPGQFGQDIFTLRSSFLEGRPPKSVNMHWRRFKIADIPINNTKAFDVWLRNRWREKDYMLEYFTKHGRFPADDYWKEHLADAELDRSSSSSLRSVAKPAKTIETEVKSAKFEEFLRIFAPITALAMALFLAYGASPDQLPFPDGGKFLQENLGALMGTMTGPGSFGDMEKMLEAGPSIPTAPPKLSLGNSPADKAKQQKYLQLFKDSLPPEVSLQAEQRRRVQSFIDSLPSKEEAQRAAMAGAKSSFEGRNFGKPKPKPQAKAASVAGPRTTGQKKIPPKANTVHGGTASQGPKTALPAKAPPPVKVNKGKPKYAVVNGVRIQVQGGDDEENSAGNAPTSAPKFIETKSGVKIKQPASEQAAGAAKAGQTASGFGFVQTKDGVKIKQSAAAGPSGSAPQRGASQTPLPNRKAPAAPHASMGRPAANKAPSQASKPAPAPKRPAVVKPATSGQSAARKPVSQAKTGQSTASSGGKAVMTPSGPRKLQS